MTQIIPNTENLEVAKVAAALQLSAGAPTQDLTIRVRRFVAAYEVVAKVLSEGKKTEEIEKLLGELRNV